MKQFKIKVCMGSSCYSKGSNEIVSAIRVCIEKEKCCDVEIELTGCLCQGECMKGPMVEVNNKIYTNVTPLTVTQLLKKDLMDIK